MKTTCFKLLNRITQRLQQRKSFPACAAVMALAAGLATSASASQGLINVDVYLSNGWPFSGVGVLGSAGNTWNEISGSASNLKNSLGDKTSAALSISGFTGVYANLGGSAPANNPATSGLLGDYLNTSGGTITYRLTGLRPNSSYDLVVYCVGDSSDQSATLSGAISYTMGTVVRGALQEGANYARNMSTMSDGDGTITFSSYASGWQGFNGLQIAGDIPPAVTLSGYSNVPIGADVSLTLSISTNLNQDQDYTVVVGNSSPGVVSLPGAVNGVVSVTFAKGAATSQSIVVRGVAFGTAALTANAWPLATVTTVPASGMIGHWLAGQQDLTDTAGYAPAGTHDGVLVGAFASYGMDFSSDVPAGFSGYSANLATYGDIIQIPNTSQANDGANYRATFDDLTAQQISVAFWAKTDPNTALGEWQPIVTKRGEGSVGWQVRRASFEPVGGFTVRGTSGPDDVFDGSTIITNSEWHHFVATRDGVTGLRKLYVDGKLNNFVPNDSGLMGVPRDAYLLLGGRWSQDSGSGGNAGNPFYGSLFDVRIYAVALNGSQVQNLVSPNTSSIVTYADTPVIDLGKSGLVSISIPDGANDSQAVVVSVNNLNPGVVSILGASGNPYTIIFPAGGPTTKALFLTGLGEGTAQIAFSAPALASASASVSVYGNHLIGQWVKGSETLADISGFTAAGTHDGMISGNAANLAYSTNVPPSKTGKSLDLTAGGFGVLITNSSVLDSGYARTFDDLTASKFSVTLWAKGAPGNWSAFASKRGEDDLGWQVRRGNGNNGAFTVRGTSSHDGDLQGKITITDGQWHHYAAVWNGYSGVRQLYVDGILDTTLTNDFGQFCVPRNHHLMLGARESRTVSALPPLESQFQGLLYDVRIYNYPLSETDVQSQASLGVVLLSSVPLVKAGDTSTVTVTIPFGSNQSQPVTVLLSSGNTGVASIVGATANVLSLTFPVGAPLTQTVTLTGVAEGATSLSATSAGYVAGSTAINVWSAPTPRLIGHWLSGQPNLAETSGFRPAGTHDGVAVGSSASLLSFVADAPPGYSGQSLDFGANGSGGQVAVMITNTATMDGGYKLTFDNQITNKFTVAFWAKGYPEGWNPWVSKNGENNGFQFRGNPNGAAYANPAFTIRGTDGDDDVWGGKSTSLNDGHWHHYAGTWDSQTGVRTIYVDGVVQFVLNGDFGGMALPTSSHLMLGARDNNGLGNWFTGLLFDVRIYSYPLNIAEIRTLAAPPAALSVSMDYTNIPAGDTIAILVTIPSGANATQPVTVMLTNNAPNVATIVGSAGNVLMLTFPAGGSPIQSVPLVAVGPGNIDITAIMGGVSAKLSATSTVFARALIGRWLTGAADLKDKSGFTSPGTHDGVPSGNSPQLVAFNNSVPPGFRGQSLDLTANSSTVSVGVIITNSSINDSAYQPTFDYPMALTIAFWAKGFPIANWEPFVTKCGETSFGWAMRRGATYEAFTIRGTAGSDNGEGSFSFSDGNWHHYVGTWDGFTGIRQVYVDGILDPSVNLTSDFGPMGLAIDKHLGLGTRENPGWADSYFPGLLYDVRVYNYSITPSEVASLQVGIPNVILNVRVVNGAVILSWPSSATGYVLQSSSVVNSGWSNSSLTSVVQDGQNVVTDTATGGAKFYRLVNTAN